MPGHHRHVLQMAFAAFVAHRAVVGMIDHQPLDDAGPESLRLRIVDGNADAVVGRRHAGHDDLTARVLFVFELLDRALPAGAHRTQRRMPAKIGQIKAQRKTRLQKILTVLDLIGLACRYRSSPSALSPRTAFFADMPFEVFLESTSARSAAVPWPPAPGRRRCGPVPAACVCRPVGRCLRAWPWPVFDGRQACRSTQGSPSRHGVHQPQDSCAKNRIEVEHHADRTGLVVQDRSSCRFPAGCRLAAPNRNPS